MRRDDRAVDAVDEIFEMLMRCTTVTLGMHGGDFPYQIPMTFGCAMEDGKIAVYLHSANEGRKCDLIAEDNRVCIEAHRYLRTEQAGGGITAKFESVIGFGKAVLLTDTTQKVAAFKIMLDHYNSSGFPVTSCRGLAKSNVYKIVLDEVTGKHNL